MKKIFLFLILFFFIKFSFAQLLLKPGDNSDASLPQWVKMMYAENPNVLLVEKLHDEYYKTHPETEDQHTAYYKHWRRYIQPYVQDDGTIKFPTPAERIDLQQRTKSISSSRASSASWNFAGPEKNFRARYSTSDPIAQISWHANVYCIDQSASNPNTLYCGGENGGVYKSTDKGFTWNYISLNEDMTTVSSVAVNPNDENDVLVNADQQTYRSTNGGATWSIPNAQLNNLTVHQFMHNPANTQMVYAGTNTGLKRSLDGGTTWTTVYSGECQSVAIMPGNANVVFALRYDAATKISYFYKSIDSGATFTIKQTGWFTVPSVDNGLIQSYGGRIAVTEADPNRVYVLLVGESQAAAQLQLNGQIGVLRSDDGGETWSNPHGVIGAPYDVNTHPNMMTFSGDNNTYNQIYYNTALIVSQLNADRIIVGGMSMWRSDDAGTTFQPVGGYVGSVANIHPDNQEFKIYKTSPTTEEMWWSCDGGINYSTDFVATHESRTNGIYGTAFWGFDQGWNDDIMVGGRYHNGNSARRDGYPNGAYQQLGGGEAATGYVNYSNEKKTYFSDIDGIVLPDTLNGIATRFPINTDPNESYVDNSSSRMMFDWDYWNVCYLGKDNKMYKSTNGGSSFGDFFTFGSAAGDKIYWIEQSRANTNVMYAQQVVSNISKIWKTTDRGISWNQITLPQNKRELNFTLSATDADELWISYPSGTDGNKVYHTINSGANWINTTSATLNGFQIKAMCHQYGTDGGVYLGTYHGPVFYRNNTLSDWQVVGNNLPFISYPLRLVPFYRDNKIRLATWHLGIWENQLYEPSNIIADFSANYESFYCTGDTIRFVPHCVASANATYQWTFAGATPATSTLKYPEVVYTASGNFDVTLIVTDNTLSDTITKIDFIKTINNGTLPLQENFESGHFAAEWKLEGTGITASNWNILNAAGGFGNSAMSMQYDNYNYDAQGAHDGVWTAKYNFTNVQHAKLFFDVAYTPYGGQYSDTLEVRASTDCGTTFTSFYLKGGINLATAPPISSAAFVPTASQWRTDTIDVTSLAGSNEVLFSFENIGHFGQVLYIDNINLAGILNSVSDIGNGFGFSVYPNPVQDYLTLSFSQEERIKECEIEIFSTPGKIVYTTRIEHPDTHIIIPASGLAAGFYFIKISSGEKKGIARFSKVN
jgi:photosystem II stability/assembly factor-like uncharacterized protein